MEKRINFDEKESCQIEVSKTILSQNTSNLLNCRTFEPRKNAELENRWPFLRYTKTLSSQKRHLIF